MAKKDITKYLELLKSEDLSLLEFLKAKFPVFHNSNIFYRDFQYGIRSFLEKKEIEISYSEAGELAAQMALYFEEKGIFKRVNSMGWKINFPEFVATEPGDPF